jgi:hypothetical protein
MITKKTYFTIFAALIVAVLLFGTAQIGAYSERYAVPTHFSFSYEAPRGFCVFECNVLYPNNDLLEYWNGDCVSRLQYTTDAFTLSPHDETLTLDCKSRNITDYSQIIHERHDLIIE